MKRNTGGSVFGGDEVIAVPPSQYAPQEAHVTITTGLTLRDFFAGQALVTLMVADAKTVGITPASAAEAAYRYADAMLTERSKQ